MHCVIERFRGSGELIFQIELLRFRRNRVNAAHGKGMTADDSGDAQPTPTPYAARLDRLNGVLAAAGAEFTSAN